MLCNYQNITDYCTNKFSYQYYDVVSAGPGQLAATGNNLSPVVRTDKDTGEKIVLYPDSTLIIEPCSASDDELETISAWQCYQLFLLSDTAVVAPADISIVKNKQIDNVNANFYSSLNDGLIININGYSPIVLKTSIEDQVNYGNIAMLANMLYAEDTDNPMPALLDVNNVAYYLSYSVLNDILTKYFNTFASKKYIKDDSIQAINEPSNTLDDINLEYFCVGKIPGCYTSPTIISEITIKEPPLLPFDDIPIADTPTECGYTYSLICVELDEEGYPGTYAWSGPACSPGVCDNDQLCNPVGTIPGPLPTTWLGTISGGEYTYTCNAANVGVVLDESIACGCYAT